MPKTQAENEGQTIKSAFDRDALFLPGNKCFLLDAG